MTAVRTHMVRLIEAPELRHGWDAYAESYARNWITRWRKDGIHLTVEVEAPNMPTAKRWAIRKARAGLYQAEIDEARAAR